MASEIPMITVYVQNMSGEILTLTCPVDISTDDFYHLVHQSLPEPRPLIHNIRLLQKKIKPSLSEDSKEAQEDDDYVSLAYILTLTCPVDISIDDFYHLVHQSLPEPRPLIHNIRLLQNKIKPSLSEDSKEAQEDDDYVSLAYILDEHTIYLFIEDVKIDIRFLYRWPAIVENNDPYFPVMYDDGTHFEKYSLQVFLNDKKIMDYDFHTLVIEEYGPSPDFHYYKKYTNIYHNDDDIENVGGISEYYNGGGDEVTIRFKEYSDPYPTPVFLVSRYLLGVHSHLEDKISEMVYEKWMEHVIKTGDDVLHTYPLK
jgi:hypothetical protein